MCKMLFMLLSQNPWRRENAHVKLFYGCDNIYTIFLKKKPKGWKDWRNGRTIIWIHKFSSANNHVEKIPQQFLQRRTGSWIFFISSWNKVNFLLLLSRRGYFWEKHEVKTQASLTKGTIFPNLPCNAAELQENNI